MGIMLLLALFWGGVFNLVIFLYLLSAIAPPKLSQHLEFYARAITSFAALFLAATYGIVAGIGLKLVGKSGLTQWTVARWFKWTMGLSTGVWFDLFEGAEHLTERPMVILGNHQSELDVLMLGELFPKWTSVSAKKSLKYTPFLGWFMALSNTIFIDRANRQTAVAAFDRAANFMRSKQQNVFIFPEGTRSYAETPTLLPFKKGAFHLAIQAQVPIVVAVAANYSAILNIKRKIFKPGTIKIKVLPPIPTEGKTPADVDELVRTTREAMLNTLDELAKRPETNGAMAFKSSATATGTDVHKDL